MTKSFSYLGLQFTVTKAGEDAYKVSHQGEEIGTVTKSWHRNGGAGWAAFGGNHQLGKTLKDAAFKLIQKSRRA